MFLNNRIDMTDKINAWFQVNGRALGFFMMGFFTVLALNDIVSGNYVIATIEVLFVALNYLLSRGYD